MSKEQEIIYTQGLPASGKSTWAKEEVKKSQGKIKRVNKDDLRAMIDNAVDGGSKHNEAFIIKARDALIKQALNEGLSVISDDTNLAPKHVARFQEIADEYKKQTGKRCSVRLKDFTDVSVQECIKRDALRIGNAHVGANVILRMHNQFLKKEAKRYVPPVDGLPKAVICDLDGTLALMNGRDPFDASTCDNDVINEPVMAVLKAFMETAVVSHVIFMSGREAKYMDPTLRFLSKCGFRDGLNTLAGDFKLFMRNTGDVRKDSIVKSEMFYANIHGKYNPILWLDDRTQVVRMIRDELGITVFQVADGDF